MAQAQLMRVAKMLKRHMDKVKSRPRGPAGGPAPKKKKMNLGKQLDLKLLQNQWLKRKQE